MSCIEKLAICELQQVYCLRMSWTDKLAPTYLLRAELKLCTVGHICNMKSLLEHVGSLHPDAAYDWPHQSLADFIAWIGKKNSQLLPDDC